MLVMTLFLVDPFLAVAILGQPRHRAHPGGTRMNDLTLSFVRAFSRCCWSSPGRDLGVGAHGRLSRARGRGDAGHYAGDPVLSFTDGDVARWLGSSSGRSSASLRCWRRRPGSIRPRIPPRIKVALSLVDRDRGRRTLEQTAPLTLLGSTVDLIFEQVMVGVAIGFAMQLTLDGDGACRRVRRHADGVRLRRPARRSERVPVPVMSNFFSLVGLMLFLSLNGHLVLLGVL